MAKQTRSSRSLAAQLSFASATDAPGRCDVHVGPKDDHWSPNNVSVLSTLIIQVYFPRAERFTDSSTTMRAL